LPLFGTTAKRSENAQRLKSVLSQHCILCSIRPIVTKCGALEGQVPDRRMRVKPPSGAPAGVFWNAVEFRREGGVAQGKSKVTLGQRAGEQNIRFSSLSRLGDAPPLHVVDVFRAAKQRTDRRGSCTESISSSVSMECVCWQRRHLQQGHRNRLQPTRFHPQHISLLAFCASTPTILYPDRVVASPHWVCPTTPVIQESSRGCGTR
jgi:hypothetical protein